MAEEKKHALGCILQKDLREFMIVIDMKQYVTFSPSLKGGRPL